MEEAIVIGVLNGRGEATDLLNAAIAVNESVDLELDDLTFDVLMNAGWTPPAIPRP